MHISHTEAIQLIQFQADNILPGNQEKVLSEHLKACSECRTYAQQLNKTENVLKSVMLKQWNVRPAPLSVAALMETTGKKSSSAILITRTAFISVALFTFVMLGLQFTATSPTAIHGTQFEVLPNPTPSSQITATIFSSTKNCQQIHYQVQKNDTLESIVSHFATSKEAVMALNNMISEVVQSNTELLVPVCDTTPTSTLNPPTFTITPILEPFTSTPG